jgi:hypothetical protein
MWIVPEVSDRQKERFSAWINILNTCNMWKVTALFSPPEEPHGPVPLAEQHWTIMKMDVIGGIQQPDREMALAHRVQPPFRGRKGTVMYIFRLPTTQTFSDFSVFKRLGPRCNLLAAGLAYTRGVVQARDRPGCWARLDGITTRPSALRSKLNT